MTSQPGLQTTAIHILPDISQSKGNQTMKFDQLIEYNKRNQQMNIHVIIQVKKNTRVQRNPVLFKSSSIFQRFD